MRLSMLTRRLVTRLPKVNLRAFALMCLGWSAAAMIALAAAGVIASWITSIGSTHLLTIPAGSTELQLGAADGVLMIGVNDASPTPRWGRGGWRSSLYHVHPDSDSSFYGFALAGHLFGWAVGVPHLFVLACLMVGPAWWVLVVRARREQVTRREQGLCRHCGYDLRESPELCAECGESARRAPALYQPPPT